jgi:hypothetical protein
MALPTLEQNRTRRLQVYAFASTVDATVRALTPDDTGANLPEAYAPWRQNGWGTAITVESATDPIAVGVRRDGFLLVGGAPRDG